MILDEIRIYALQSGRNTEDDNLNIAYEYLSQLELLDKISVSVDVVIDRLKQSGFHSTQDIINFCIEDDNKSIVIGWNGKHKTLKN